VLRVRRLFVGITLFMHFDSWLHSPVDFSLSLPAKSNKLMAPKSMFSLLDLNRLSIRILNLLRTYMQ
jgi:hypothetical protein